MADRELQSGIVRFGNFEVDRCMELPSIPIQCTREQSETTPPSKVCTVRDTLLSAQKRRKTAQKSSLTAN
jgi:hypothetical protein